MRPVRSRKRADAESRTVAMRRGDAPRVAANALSPGPPATPTCNFPGPVFRKASPSANASTMGKPNTQKTASGSRLNSRMRESASWYIGCSRITELPSGERDEHVVERGVMRGEQRQLHAARFEQREQRGEGAVQLYDRERDSVGTRPHRGHTPHLSQDLDQIVRSPALRQREVHHVVRAQRRNQLLGSSLGDDLAVIHDRDAIAEALGFLHVVRREQHRSAVGAEAADDLPQLTARLRVETRRGFIEKEQLGLADERTGDREPLLLPARKGHHARLAFLLELDEREHFLDGMRLAVKRAKQSKHFADGELVGELR